jgi:hypothetical protein
MPPIQLVTRAVHERLPIHLLLRHIEGGDVLGVGGPEKDAGGASPRFSVVLQPLTVVWMARSLALMTRFAVK